MMSEELKLEEMDEDILDDVHRQLDKTHQINMFDLFLTIKEMNS